MKQLIVLLVGVLVFSSCEKVIEPGDLPEQDARLVINSVLKKDSVCSVYLSSSKSIISGKDYKTVDNAFCAVYENDVLFEQLSFKGKGMYVGTKKPTAGKTYKIVARASGFADVDGSTVMPEGATVNKVQRIDSILFGGIFINQDGVGPPAVNGSLYYKIYLKEYANTADYYAIGAQLLLYDTTGALLNHLVPVSVYEGSNQGFVGNGLSSFIGSDEEGVVNGERIFNLYLNAYEDLSTYQLPKIGRVELALLTANISADYYKYRSTTEKQATTSASFFAEPTIIYSNCSNGMGIVGSANYNSKVVYSQKIK